MSPQQKNETFVACAVDKHKLTDAYNEGNCLLYYGICNCEGVSDERGSALYERMYVLHA
jgi:hypothetical protein